MNSTANFRLQPPADTTVSIAATDAYAEKPNDYGDSFGMFSAKKEWQICGRLKTQYLWQVMRGTITKGLFPFTSCIPRVTAIRFHAGNSWFNPESFRAGSEKIN